jgi:peptidoglycan DL-endopeptidase CwlO
VARQIDGLALGTIAAGSLFAYAGLKGYSVPHAVQALVQGQPPSAGGPANPITGASIPASTAGQNNIGAGAQGGSAGANQMIAKSLAAKYGWDSGAEWAALVRLWNSESGWSNTIWNTSASCGGGAYAYGIPQACGHGERKQTAHSAVGPFPAGNPGNPPEYGGTSNAAAQINWGLAYIRDTYGSPSATPLGGY